MVEHHSDEQLQKMRRGGHDPEKVYAAYQQAIAHQSAPTVILAKTIKGYGMGEAGEGKNITHQQKKLTRTKSAFSAPASVSPSRTTRSRRRRSIGPRTTAQKCSISASGGKALAATCPSGR